MDKKAFLDSVPCGQDHYCRGGACPRHSIDKNGTVLSCFIRAMLEFPETESKQFIKVLNSEDNSHVWVNLNKVAMIVEHDGGLFALCSHDNVLVTTKDNVVEVILGKKA